MVKDTQKPFILMRIDSNNYEYALKSFRKIMGYDAITGFNISVAEIQKWKDSMKHGVKGKGCKLIGKISDTTSGVGCGSSGKGCPLCSYKNFAIRTKKSCLISYVTSLYSLWYLLQMTLQWLKY